MSLGTAFQFCGLFLLQIYGGSIQTHLHARKWIDCPTVEERKMK
jgi:hypothetical protein